MVTGFQTPEWVKDAVFYQIFPDRFAISKKVPKPNNLEVWESPPSVYGFKGGDLLGVAEHLDYLEDLGINAIYFNPIFQSTANHRYHTHDYFKVDPILGGDPAFRYLLDKAHRKGIRILLDGVFNHVSRGFFQFNHILESGAKSPYTDWFYVNGYPLNAYQGQANYQCWWNLPALPKFNTENPQVRSFIFDVARYWIEQGIDGWRLDVPFEIDDDEFWQEFRQIVKETNPDAYLVGEVPWEAQHWCRGDIFDAVMNYQFTQACLGFFAGHSINRKLEDGMMGLPSTQVLDAPAFAQRVVELLNLYPREAVYAQLNLLDSHDMPRFISLANGDKSSLRLATLFQMTYPGAPCIYYGDEIGIDSREGRMPEFARKSFQWDQSQWDSELRNYIKECIQIRKAYPVLRQGDFSTLYAKDQVLAYMRQLDQDKLVIAINTGNSDYTSEIPIYGHLTDGLRLFNILGPGETQIMDGKIHGLTIPARTGIILAEG
ncbi:MAG: glycoside hydrolase family 13 protein [Anaerolineales bacterium]|nr:glycoside hydrolase family 13 protein [Anaerolineales bacterium]